MDWTWWVYNLLFILIILTIVLAVYRIFYQQIYKRYVEMVVKEEERKRKEEIKRGFLSKGKEDPYMIGRCKITENPCYNKGDCRNCAVCGYVNENYLE